MAGLELPVLCMAHQYLITEEMEEVVAYNNANDGKEIVHAIDFDGEIYMRQEGKGMLMGTYEPNGIPWSPTEAPWDFSTELLPPDLDQIADNLERGFKHHPAFQMPASRTSSMARLPSGLTATRWLARSGACRTTGWHAASWPASVRAAVSAWH